jgi:hypothetical protein
MYRITQHSYDRAKQLGVRIEPSHRPDKKIDIYAPSGHYITSIGARGFDDYGTFLNEYGPTYANERRRLYKIRHNKDRKVVGSKGWFADQILW